MISFCQNDFGMPMYKDNAYLGTGKFVIERPANEDDVAAHPDEHAAFIAAATPVALVPVRPAPADSTPVPAGER